MQKRLLPIGALILLLFTLVSFVAPPVSFAQANESRPIQAEIDNAQSHALRLNGDSQKNCAKFIGTCWYWWAGGGAIALIIVAIVFGNRRDRIDTI